MKHNVDSRQDEINQLYEQINEIRRQYTKLNKPIQTAITDLHQEMNIKMQEYHNKSNQAARKVLGDFDDLSGCANMAQSFCQGKKHFVVLLYCSLGSEL